MDYSTWWTMVFGDRTAEQVVEEFGLYPPDYRAIRKWVAICADGTVEQGADTAVRSAEFAVSAARELAQVAAFGVEVIDA